MLEDCKVLLILNALFILHCKENNGSVHSDTEKSGTFSWCSSHRKGKYTHIDSGKYKNVCYPYWLWNSDIKN